MHPDPTVFLGYDAPEASRRKVVSNVFSMGDKGFVSGDLLRVDERGWCYFVRRMGDCYRWRGENISAQQVERQVGEDSGLACPIVAIGPESKPIRPTKSPALNKVRL